jgi:hypothetical protein
LQGFYANFLFGRAGSWCRFPSAKTDLSQTFRLFIRRQFVPADVDRVSAAKRMDAAKTAGDSQSPKGFCVFIANM